MCLDIVNFGQYRTKSFIVKGSFTLAVVHHVLLGTYMDKVGVPDSYYTIVYYIKHIIYGCFMYI